MRVLSAITDATIRLVIGYQHVDVAEPEDGREREYNEGNDRRRMRNVSCE
jgi:hypothetical protein